MCTYGNIAARLQSYTTPKRGQINRPAIRVAGDIEELPRLTLGGQTSPGYADWRGFPDSVPTNDPTTWVFVGSGSTWRLLSAAELRAATVRLVQLYLGYSNGPYKPGTKATGL
jgi:hypothetical protein